MTENEHTFLPLELQAVQDGHYVEINVFNSEGRLLAEHNYLGTVPNGEKLFDMFAFIVSACNCHDELVGALEAFMHDDGCFCDAAFAGPGTIVRHSDECIAACSALAKARGEQ